MEKEEKNKKRDGERRATVDDISMDDKAKSRIKDGISDAIEERVNNNVFFDTFCTGAGGIVVGGCIFFTFSLLWATALGVVGGGYGGYKLAQMTY